jgi:uncharacterized surface protein with fasciclin (FAS1) repeats
MSNYAQKSIVATLGIAIASTGLLYSLSSHAQSGTPGTTTTPTPTTTPSGGAMTKPTGTMSPSGGSMSQPTGTMSPGGMSKPSKTPATTTTGKTIVDVAAGNKSFTTLVKALKAADLVETLSGVGPYTVFAPTNEAFNKLPKGTLTTLLKPENKAQLQKVLTYHVVAGEVTSKMLKAGKVPTVAGADITVKISGKNVTINKSKVIKADVKASNGVIHAIDTVLLPPAN